MSRPPSAMTWPSRTFDRLLVAQARTEQFTLVTADGAIKRYDVPIMPART
jgi:PIN domain nuclease of toxin-antitoxin system